MQIKTVGDVLHRLIASAPWEEQHKTDAYDILVKEFNHPTPNAVVTVAAQLHEENAVLKDRIAKLEAAFEAAGIVPAQPAAASVKDAGSAFEVARLRAENEKLRAEVTDKAAAEVAATPSA